MAKTAAQPETARWRKFTRRAGLVGIGLLVLAILAFMLLPFWISNDQGRAYVLDRLNARLNGPRVTIDKWSLGWLHASELTNLKIFQPDGTEILSCPHVSSGLTLWDLFRGNYDLRNTTADQLEMRITKFADGTTSLDSLTRGAGDILQSARGAVQVRDGRLTFASARTGQVVRYEDVRASLTVASPEAPFHLQISAVGVPPAASGATGSVSLNGTFPPTAHLSANSLRHPGVWGLLGDVDFTAAHLPTALVCDYVGVEAAWAESFGEMLASIQVSGHPTATQDGSRVTCVIRGTGGPGAEQPGIDTLLLLSPPRPAGTQVAAGGTLAVPAGKDYHADASLRWSAPLAGLLGRLNPMLGEAAASRPAPPAPPTAAVTGGLVQGNVMTMSIPLDRLDATDATARVTFPPLVFVPRDGPSMVRQMQVITGELPAVRPGGGGAGGAVRMEGSASVLRFRLADRKVSYENFLVTLGRSKATFSGTVGWDGALELTG